MDDSEFVVIDEGSGHEVKEAVRCLKNAEESYRNAHDTLVKSNILLQDSLNLVLHQALQSVPPDVDTNIEELTQRINDSLYTSTETVLRDHVKSLCSRLVGVTTENTKISDELRQLQLQNENIPQLERLGTLFDEIEALLPPNDETPADLSEVEKLCARAERIRDCIQAGQLSSIRVGTPIEELRQQPVIEQEPPPPSNCVEENKMLMSKMIREEVLSVLTREMSTIIDQQKELLRDALQPLADQLKQDHPAPPPPTLQSRAEALPHGSLWGSVASAPRQVSDPVAPTLDPRSRVSVFDAPPFGMHKTAPTAQMPPLGSHWSTAMRQSKPMAPTYAAEEENPTCPKCNTNCHKRIYLEAHLDKCLA